MDRGTVVTRMTSCMEHDMSTSSTGRRGNKPGRKPLDTEAKSRRTAQNRAAQRAFRERKEQKMRDLEEQLKKVEEKCQNSERETQFLRMQVVAMLRGLRRFRDGVRFPQLPVGAEKQPEKQRLWESLVREEQLQYEQLQVQQQQQNPEALDDLDTALVQMPSPHSSESELSMLDAMEKSDGALHHVDSCAGEYVGESFYESNAQSLMPLPCTPNHDSFEQNDIGCLGDPTLQMATSWGGAEPAPSIPSRTLTPSFNQLIGPPVCMPADWYAQDITASMDKGQSYADPPVYAAPNLCCPVYEDDMLAYLQ